LRLNISSNSQWAKSPVFVNGRKDTRVNFSAGININLRYSGEGDFDYGVQWNYRKTKATFEIDQISERAYETQTWNGNLGLNFLKNWRFLTNMNYSIYAGEAFEEIQKIPIWNVSLSTKILPNDRLQLKASLFDLLNRNQGVNRSNGLNTITEERVNALSRYFLVTATWSVTRLGK
jgi:hypothetical protein